MKALVKEERSAGIKMREWPVRKPGASEVLVRVRAAGICGSDRHIFKWDEARHPFSENVPFVLGHEGAGVVEAIGSRVKQVKIGDRVAFESHIHDNCEYVRQDLENICPHKKILGIGTDGVFAEYVTVPAYIIRPLPKTISLEVGAIFEPATIGLRALETLKELPRQPKNILVFGATGIMGAVAALAAKLYGYKAIAVGRNQAKLEKLQEVDPGLTIVNTQDTDLGAWAKGKFIEAVIETTGSASILELASKLIVPAGTWIQIGIFGQSSDTYRKLINALVRNEILFKGVVGRTKREWQRMIELVGERKLNLEPLITHRFKLEQFDQAFEGKEGIKSIFIIG